ncbi:MAG TPA: LPXTG cell wall anchor domain-containing protein [Steroidobacteraceae bacterium]|nr:LPXTG cell wall anchor domain-containing protein [Steroidobacteraceae bacterium]
MRVRSLKFLPALAGAVVLAASVTAVAQSVEKSFTASGTSCNQIIWSREALAKYPNLTLACREVLQKNGKSYVKFEGTVQRVKDGGKTLLVNFKGADTYTLHPPEGMTVNIGGKQTAMKDLQPGDTVTFFVPEDRLALDLTPEPTPPMQEIALAPAPMEQAAPAAEEQAPLPKTASSLPWFAVFGLLFATAGAALTLRRRLRPEA